MVPSSGYSLNIVKIYQSQDHKQLTIVSRLKRGYGFGLQCFTNVSDSVEINLEQELPTKLYLIGQEEAKGFLTIVSEKEIPANEKGNLLYEHANNAAAAAGEKDDVEADMTCNLKF